MKVHKTFIYPISPQRFFSREFQSLPFEEQRAILGGHKKDKPPRIKKEEERKTARRYIRIFKDVKNSDKAKEMLFEGMSYSRIARHFGCDHTSVMAFKERCEKVGIVFPKPIKFQPGANISITISSIVITESIVAEVTPADEELPNRNKTYAEIVKKYNEEKKAIVEKRMAEAKATIEKVHQYRKENNIKTIYEYDTGVY